VCYVKENSAGERIEQWDEIEWWIIFIILSLYKIRLYTQSLVANGNNLMEIMK
jgi:hypothetical protein